MCCFSLPFSPCVPLPCHALPCLAPHDIQFECTILTITTLPPLTSLLLPAASQPRSSFKPCTLPYQPKSSRIEDQKCVAFASVHALEKGGGNPIVKLSFFFVLSRPVFLFRTRVDGSVGCPAKQSLAQLLLVCFDASAHHRLSDTFIRSNMTIGDTRTHSLIIITGLSTTRWTAVCSAACEMAKLIEKLV